MGSNYRSAVPKRSNENARLTVSTILGVVLGFFVGVSFPTFSINKVNLSPMVDLAFTDNSRSIGANLPLAPIPHSNKNRSSRSHGSGDSLKACGWIGMPPLVLIEIYVATNPRGAELLPPGIIVPETDLYLRRLWGDPKEDLTTQPKYLVTFTIGFDQSKNIDKAVKKFSEDFTIMLFHYDGRASEWEQFEWSKRAIHVTVKKQSKWWYVKRFLHPDVVAAYEYIFVWDEDLGLENFDVDKYLQLVKKHGLDISQPGLEPNGRMTWEMTKRKGDSEVHKETSEKPGWCSDPHEPPCAAFVEMMAPVFSRDAWRCVWHMIQNDLVHGWGLDFALRRCVEPAYEKIGVVDSQWIIHQFIPSLGNQGVFQGWKAPWRGVRERSKFEWSQFQARLAHADRAYLDGNGRE